MSVSAQLVEFQLKTPFKQFDLSGFEIYVDGEKLGLTNNSGICVFQTNRADSFQLVKTPILDTVLPIDSSLISFYWENPVVILSSFSFEAGVNHAKLLANLLNTAQAKIYTADTLQNFELHVEIKDSNGIEKLDGIYRQKEYAWRTEKYVLGQYTDLKYSSQNVKYEKFKRNFNNRSIQLYHLITHPFYVQVSNPEKWLKNKTVEKITTTDSTIQYKVTEHKKRNKTYLFTFDSDTNYIRYERSSKNSEQEINSVIIEFENGVISKFYDFGFYPKSDYTYLIHAKTMMLIHPETKKWLNAEGGGSFLKEIYEEYKKL